MNDTDRERTGGTSSGDASGNPPVVSSPAFKTNRQILDELLSDGFRDAATPEASHILEHVSYQHFLPYVRATAAIGDPSLVTINTANNLMTFDRRMQATVLKYIGVFEARFRALYLSTIAECHGAYAIYDSGLFLRADRHAATMANYEREVSNRIKRDAPMRRAYENGCGKLPLWMGLECMTLGTLSALYSNTADKTASGFIANSLGCTKAELSSWMRTITAVRNICAHFEPLFVRRQIPSVPKKIIGVNCPRTAPLYAVLLLVKLLEEPGFTSSDRNLIYARRLEEDAGVYINMVEGFYGSVPLSNFPAYWRSLLHLPVLRQDGATRASGCQKP